MHKQKKLRSDRYFVRCEACVGDVHMSARVGVDVSATGDEFREKFWAELMNAAAEDGVDVSAVDLPDVSAHYVLKVQLPAPGGDRARSVSGHQTVIRRRSRGEVVYDEAAIAGGGGDCTISVAMNLALKPQLPKPCRLVLCLSDSYMAMDRLVNDEAHDRRELAAGEHRTWRDLLAQEAHGHAKAVWAAQQRIYYERESAALEKAAVSAMIETVKDEETARVQFEMLASLKRAYDEYQRMLQAEMESITQQKRGALTYSKAVLATAQRRHESYHKGCAQTARAATVSVSATQVYSVDRMPHRWEVDLLTEDSLLRKRHRLNRDELMAQSQKPPVTITPGYVASAQSLREMIKTSGYN